MIQSFTVPQISRRALAPGMEPDANACRLIESSDFDWCEVSTS
jgi:hypothetical protein